MSFPRINGTEVFRSPPTAYYINFDDPKQKDVLAHYLVFGLGIPIAFTTLLQRFYTKMFLSQNGLEVDDVFMFFGWCFSLTTQVLIITSIAQRGMCVHSWEMPLDAYERYLKLNYAAAPIYMLCNGCIKLSLLALYLQIATPKSVFRLAVWFVTGIVVVCSVTITFMLFFVCAPARKAFDVKAEGSCKSVAWLYIVNAVFNIATTVILFALPLPTIINLRRPTVEKVGATTVLAIGAVTIFSSAIRLWYLPSILHSTDPSWDASPASIWTIVEANLFVVCGSTPTLRTFFRHFVPRFCRLSSGGSNTDVSPRERQGTVSGCDGPCSVSRRGRECFDVEIGYTSDGDKLRTTTITASGTGDGLPIDDSNN